MACIEKSCSASVFGVVSIIIYSTHHPMTMVVRCWLVHNCYQLVVDRYTTNYIVSQVHVVCLPCMAYAISALTYNHLVNEVDSDLFLLKGLVADRR